MEGLGVTVREPASPRHVYLMRGLPSSGKSTTAQGLAGAQGVVCETDAYFHECVGRDPKRFDYRPELMPAARQWNFERFCAAVDTGRSPIVVDRGNSVSAESSRYARYALEHGYTVSLAEPDSPAWRELRVLLKYKSMTGPALDAWAQKLAALSLRTHRVPAKQIRQWMARWRSDVTMEDILAYQPNQTQSVTAS